MRRLMKMKERNTQPALDNSPEIFLRSKEGRSGRKWTSAWESTNQKRRAKKGTLQWIFSW